MSVKILLAEDNTDVAEVIAFGARMTWPEYRLTIATSGMEARMPLPPRRRIWLFLT
jgi:hypothetical protein